MPKVITLVSIIFFNIYRINSAKILAVYPVACISHQLYFRTLTMELLKRGHEMTVITTDPAFKNKTAPKNIREIDIHDVSYKIWTSFLEVPLGESIHLNTQIRTAMDIISEVLENVFKVEAVKHIIENKDETFDILLYDGCVLANIIFSYIHNIPAIAVNSLGGVPENYESVGAVVNEAYYPSYMSLRTAKTQVERFKDVVKYYYNLIDIQWYIERAQNEAVKKGLGVDMPDIRDLKRNINMMFINLYTAWDSNRPSSISLKHLGGLHSVPEEPLPEDIKSYLDSSTAGVIYMSLGTNVKCSRLPPEKIQVFKKVFSQLPHDVLWKWDIDTMTDKPNNVRIFKWLPQSDVLKHPKIKVFISQGGLQSTDEAVAAGVPLIGIPMLGDQWFNTGKYEHYNLGVQLNMEDLTEQSLSNAIHNVIGNNSYRTNIINYRNLMLDQPLKALDRAVQWIEYVIRHGGSHLRAPAADVSWPEYVELELMTIVVLVTGIFVITLWFIVKFLASSLWRISNKKCN